MEQTFRRKTSQEAESFARKMLEILGMARASVRFSGHQQEDMVRLNLPLDYVDWKPIKTALLKAERQKAKALMEIRRLQIV